MFGRSSQFDKALEKATSQLLLEPDWDSILQLCDCIRQGDVQPKYALNSIKKKITVDNPHVAMFALQVLESCVKNCSSLIHQEIASKEFMEFLKDQVKTRAQPAKDKILELIQVWSHAFRNEPSYKAVQDTFHLMKMEGYSFPALKEADAMFVAEKAPEWKDGECCTRCRVAFGMVQRKHHCRNCGEVFCNKCSSKNCTIPRFGIEREVRVCDACHDKLKPGEKKGDNDGLPSEYLSSPLSKQSQVPPAKSEQDIQEEEELQLALALSKSEHETKEKERERVRQNYGLYRGTAGTQVKNNSAAQPTSVSAPVIDTSDMDPELARYLNRNYWQQRSEDVKAAATTTPSAPAASNEPKTSAVKIQELYQNGETEDDQSQFLSALQSSVEIFMNRMSSNSQRGRSIANDTSVQTLFTVITNMHPQLLKYIQEQEDSRSHYEALQDKLAQLRDAREALDALREDHREKKQREKKELEKSRQIQMAHKLEIMRQKKHEYIEMQRQLALQRLQEQEREMQIRLEHQKQLTHIRQMQAYGYGQAYGSQSCPQNYSPGGSLESSPVHQIQHQSGTFNQQSVPSQGLILPGSVPSQSVATNQVYISSNIQPGYQQPALTYQPSAQLQNLPAGYNQPPPESTQDPLPNSYAGQRMSFNSVTCQPSSLPPKIPQPGQTLSNSEYSSLNMQDLTAGTLSHQSVYTTPQQFVAASNQQTSGHQLKNSHETELISFD